MVAEPLAESLDLAPPQSLSLHAVALGRRHALAKRAFDIAVASLALVALSPLLLLLAILVMLTSPGGAFFVQQRCGRHGNCFSCYKFRTMIPDAQVVLVTDSALHASFSAQWKLADDPRVTSLGRVLRKTSLDELPQLWNVLKGDMSLVGPRPVLAEELRQCYREHAETVTAVRPGITGLWQVSGRSDLTYDERVSLDVAYVHHRTFWFDLRILVLTIPAVLLTRGAR